MARPPGSPSVPDPDSGISGGTNPDWGDGFDPDIVTNPGSRTANLFNAAASKEIRPLGDTVEADGIRYQFAADPTFVFSARLAFDRETGVPVITTTLESTGTAWFPAVYLGAPTSSFVDTEQVWQPLVWQGRRFPSTPYLTASCHCPVPSTLVNPHFPALRADALALSGASRRKRFPIWGQSHGGFLHGLKVSSR